MIFCYFVATLSIPGGPICRWILRGRQVWSIARLSHLSKNLWKQLAPTRLNFPFVFSSPLLYFLPQAHLVSALFLINHINFLYYSYSVNFIYRQSSIKFSAFFAFFLYLLGWCFLYFSKKIIEIFFIIICVSFRFVNGYFNFPFFCYSVKKPWLADFRLVLPGVW